MARKKSPTNSSAETTGGRRKRSRAKTTAVAPTGLSPSEILSPKSPEAAQLDADIRADGGIPLAHYREPLGGHQVILAGLPVEKVEATPYQRDLSQPHVQRLINAMERVGRYVDPVVAVRHDGAYWTPNGAHRLAAVKTLGLRTILALVIPEPEAALQILALNCEKAHNLKERSLEVIRMFRGLSGARADSIEADFAPLFEEPAFITLGAAYEKRPRYSAGAYHPIVKRIDSFLDQPLARALPIREARADRLLALDDLVSKVISALKQRGFESAYLKHFVVARINPLHTGRAGSVNGFDSIIDMMTSMASRFEICAVRKEDLARMGSGPVEVETEE